MLRRVLSLALSLAMVLCAIPAASAAGATGRISGVAMSSNGEHLAGQVARLRSLDLGQVAAVTTTSGSGGFSFVDVNAGSYLVEIVANGAVVGTSTPVTLTRQTMTADGVMATAAAVPAAAQSGGSNNGGSFWTSKFLVISAAAAAAGLTTAIVVTKDDASPKR
jgi:hypothetical protein